MKKYLLALLLGSLLLLALATVAMADNGPHGSFTATTAACAGCHRVHTAQYGSNALLITDPVALCESCHGGLGASTNVVDGVYTTGSEGEPGNPLFGGGFENALMATKWSGKVTFDPTFNAISRPTTSMHAVGETGTIWGSGANGTGLGGSMVLECTSCHDPHGNAGYINATPVVGKENTCDPTVVATNACSTRWASYRLLRWRPQGSDGFTAPTTSVNWSGGAFPLNAPAGGTAETGWTVPDNFPGDGNEWYTLGTTGAFASGDYQAPSNANNVYSVRKSTAPGTATYIPAAVNTAFFCAQCHDRYFNNSALRNNTDQSVYCGAPVAGVVVNGVTLTVYPPTAGGQHPVDPVRCEPVYTGAAITAWGDNGPSGDLTFMYRHASGDIRLSMDGTRTAGAGTSVSRTCVACHVAHGTAADMTIEGSIDPNDDLTDDSALLRMDNRSVCLRCHANTVGFTVGP